MDEVLPSIISWVIPPKKKQKKLLKPKEIEKRKGKGPGRRRAFRVLGLEEAWPA